MIFALVGNQNCGKTTIFNQITNMNQHIGNFPGVTIDIKIGKVPNLDECKIVDLPGLYSLNTYTKEEVVTKKYITQNNIDVLINVVDATNLERNLFLTLQLKQLGIPIVIALNMLDEVEKNKGYINIAELEKRIEIPIVPITTVTKKEMNNLIETAGKIRKKANYKSNIDTLDVIETYKFITDLCESVCHDNIDKKNINKTYKIDKILTNKYLGIPIFILIMYVIFYLTFNVIGDYLTNLINIGIEVVTGWTNNILIKNNVNAIIQSLIIDGVFTGIGSVVSFLPIIVTLYFFLSLLEDSGYMTRIAFLMDRPLSKLGLSGKSAVSILLGFGCSVPAILSTRTIQSERERKLTMQLIPFMSCSAKIPIYAVFVSICFKKYASIVMILLYIIGAVIGILITAFLNKKIKKSKEDTFILELPNYRFPTIKNTLLLMWNKSKEFIEKAFSVIFFASIIIWLCKSFDEKLYLTSIENCLLAKISKKITPIFSPLGFTDWRIITSIITGISAKEAVISTLSILTNTNSQLLPIYLSGILNISSCISFLLFILLYTPCIATISTIKKEFNFITSIKVALNQFLIAYAISFIAYNLSNLLLNFL